MLGGPTSITGIIPRKEMKIIPCDRKLLTSEILFLFSIPFPHHLPLTAGPKKEKASVRKWCEKENEKSHATEKSFLSYDSFLFPTFLLQKKRKQNVVGKMKDLWHGNFWFIFCIWSSGILFLSHGKSQNFDKQKIRPLEIHVFMKEFLDFFHLFSQPNLHVKEQLWK